MAPCSPVRSSALTKRTSPRIAFASPEAGPASLPKARGPKFVKRVMPCKVSKLRKDGPVFGRCPPFAGSFHDARSIDRRVRDVTIVGFPLRDTKGEQTSNPVHADHRESPP